MRQGTENPEVHCSGKVVKKRKLHQRLRSDEPELDADVPFTIAIIKPNVE
jgi:hypothetical protein